MLTVSLGSRPLKRSKGEFSICCRHILTFHIELNASAKTRYVPSVSGKFFAVLYCHRKQIYTYKPHVGRHRWIPRYLENTAKSTVKLREDLAFPCCFSTLVSSSPTCKLSSLPPQLSAQLSKTTTKSIWKITFRFRAHSGLDREQTSAEERASLQLYGYQLVSRHWPWHWNCFQHSQHPMYLSFLILSRCRHD